MDEEYDELDVDEEVDEAEANDGEDDRDDRLDEMLDPAVEEVDERLVCASSGVRPAISTAGLSTSDRLNVE